MWMNERKRIWLSNMQDLFSDSLSFEISGIKEAAPPNAKLTHSFWEFPLFKTILFEEGEFPE